MRKLIASMCAVSTALLMTDSRGRLEFNLGHRGSTATVDITNVRLEEIE